MANLVDDLLIQLGLDTSKFDKSQKKAIKNLRDMENVQRRGAKEDEKRIRNTTRGYRNLRDAVVDFGTALAGVNGIKSLISNTVGTDTNLWRQSQLLGVHARSLNAWGYVAEKFGGSQEGVTNSLQSMEGSWAKFKLGMGGTDFLTAMSRLGLKGPQDFKNFALLSRHLMAVKAAYGEQGALASAQALGLDKGTFMMLMQGPQKVQALYEKAYKLSGVTKQNAADAQKLWQMWVNVKETFAADGQVIFHDIVPALDAIAEGIEDLLLDFQKIDKATDGWTGKLVALGAALLTLRAPFAMMKKAAGLMGGAPEAGVAAGADAAAGAGVAAGATWAGMAEGGAALSATVGISAAAAGLIGWEIGRAVDAYLLSKKTKHEIGSGVAHFLAFFGDKNAQQAIAAHARYEALVAQHERMLAKNASHAHMVGTKAPAVVVTKGQTHVETHVGTIHVNAPNATDAQGVAHGIKKELHRNAVITGGIVGVT